MSKEGNTIKFYNGQEKPMWNIEVQEKGKM